MSNYSAIDMTTAAAQGFSDGVASVANSAIPNNQDASAAQGHQVECQECERLRMQLVACGVVALSNTPESAAKARDMHPDYMSASCQDVMRAVDSEMALRAELSALKAQQVGQEPQRCQCCGYLVTESEHRGCLRAAAPQPAPSQDVAGWIPVTERLPEVETDVLVRGVRRNEVMHRVAGLFNGEWSSQETEDLLRGEVTHWMPLPAAPAAHDKQSGGEV